MKKLFLLTSFLLTISCAEMIENIGCGTPPNADRLEAKSLYADITTSKIYNINPTEAKKMFGCYYQDNDEIYSYSRFSRNGYILVRDDRPVTYYEVR